MLEVSQITTVPAVTLPETCEVMLDGVATLVRVHNSVRKSEIWLMAPESGIATAAVVDGVVYGKITGSVLPLKRLHYMTPVELVTLEGFI